MDLINLLYVKHFRKLFGMKSGDDVQGYLLNYKSILILEEDEIHTETHL
jgi:hypothetical protein